MSEFGRRDFLAGAAGGALALAAPAYAGEELLAGPSVSKRALRALRGAVRGPVMFPRSAGYSRARLVYNSRFNGARPDAVVQPRDTRDVQAVVRWANRFGVRIVVKGGGHSYAGYSTIGNGVVVDLSRLRGIRVSTASKRATVGAGVQLIDMYAALSRRGVTVPAGSCPSVGVSGHALGGGMGLAGRQFGLTSDNVVALTIVTADGRVRRIDRNTNADLFWACRGGGGGNFGIVTQFTFRVHRVRSASWFQLEWPWAAADRALAAWQELLPDAPSALTSIFHLTTDGEGPPQVSANGQFFGSPGALRRLLAPLEREGGRLTVGSSGYMALMMRWAGCSGDPLRTCHTRGTRRGGTLARASFYAKSDFVGRPLNSKGRQAMIDAVERRNGDRSGSGDLLLDSYGGALNRVKADATAFAHRDELFCIQYLSYFGGAAAERDGRRWANDAARALRPHVSGSAYQNYIDAQLDRWARAYYGPNLGQLREVKKKYDPDFFFRFRQAIPPAK